MNTNIDRLLFGTSPSWATVTQPSHGDSDNATSISIQPKYISTIDADHWSILDVIVEGEPTSSEDSNRYDITGVT